MPVLRLDDVSLAFGARAILDTVNLTIDAGERVCVVGRNGEGKSTLLKVIAALQDIDDGERWLRPGHRVAMLEQDTEADPAMSVREHVLAGLAEHAPRLAAYYTALESVAQDATTANLAALAAAEQALEGSGGWAIEQRIAELLGKLDLDPNARLGSLSGGWRRRASLAKALVNEPDLLLLDEPTNHLDIDAITWLEGFMLEFTGALAFVSHDRAFSRRLATAMVDVDRGQVTRWDCGFDEFLRRRAAAYEIEDRAAAEFDKRLSKEEAWIRQGIKARRTRNEGRVRELEAMREQHRQRRQRLGRAQLQLATSDLSGKIVFDAMDVAVGYNGEPILSDINLRVLRGDRIGVVGGNGSGKSTLLKLLLGELKPLSGQVVRGTRLDTVYFDQRREQLDLSKSVFANIGDDTDYIEVMGRKRHVAGYLRQFLFPPERFGSPVATLSGGERNRLLLAKLLARPANLLVLDEPTNDLDVETLELLEEMLVQYAGTLLVVSHDRAFLDNVVTGIVHISTTVGVQEYVGNYTDFRRQYRPRSNAARRGADGVDKSAAERTQPARTKLSYKEQREFDALPTRIADLEAAIEALRGETEAQGFYQRPHDEVSERLATLSATMAELDGAYERWDELDSRTPG
ncbi:MAG: ATP-binding cassette domain-containing protein [Pseudomonadota bacterium]